MKKDYVQVTMLNGWVYKGELLDINKSSLLKSQWLKIKLNNGTILSLNLDHVLTLQYGKDS